jgi:hypothetical protein
MSLGKVTAGIFCAGVLAVQTWVICTTTKYHEYYWPFLNYPMYSRAYDAGQQIRHARLMLRPCDRPQQPVEMTFREAHLIRFVFQFRVHRAANMLRNTTPVAARNAAVSLARLAHRHVPTPTCRMEVWVQLFRIGPDGLELPGSEWIPYKGWDVRDGVITDQAFAAADGGGR